MAQDRFVQRPNNRPLQESVPSGEDRRAFLRRAAGAAALGVLATSNSTLVAATENSSQAASDLPVNVVPQLYATGFAPATGIAVDRQQTLFVSNYRRQGTIGRIAKDGTARIFCDLRELAPAEEITPLPNGLKIDSEGRLIVADTAPGRLLRIAADGSAVEILAERCDAARFERPQDVALDIGGNIYFTDSGSPASEVADGRIYCYVIETGKVTLLDDRFDSPSGIAVTPDQNRLCVAQRNTGCIWIYDLSRDGKASQRRLLAELPTTPDGPESLNDSASPSTAQPNGMVFDAHGNLYIATADGFIDVVALEGGRTLRRFPAGGPHAASCHFGKPFLYTAIASKEAVFRLELGVEGFGYNGLA